MPCPDDHHDHDPSDQISEGEKQGNCGTYTTKKPRRHRGYTCVGGRGGMLRVGRTEGRKEGYLLRTHNARSSYLRGAAFTEGRMGSPFAYCRVHTEGTQSAHFLPVGPIEKGAQFTHTIYKYPHSFPTSLTHSVHSGPSLSPLILPRSLFIPRLHLLYRESPHISTTLRIPTLTKPLLPSKSIFLILFPALCVACISTTAGAGPAIAFSVFAVFSFGYG